MKLRPPWTSHSEVRGITAIVEGASRWSSVMITSTLGRPCGGVVVVVVVVDVLDVLLVVEVVDGAGHSIQGDRPVELAALVGGVLG